MMVWNKRHTLETLRGTAVARQGVRTRSSVTSTFLVDGITSDTITRLVRILLVLKALKTHRTADDQVEHDDVLRQLPYASSAPFNSSRRQHDSLCLEGTRVDVLEGIYSWVEGGEGPPLYWLNGMAGTGKSTIARTVARRYYDEGYITASFFFSSGSGDAEGTASFVTTLAVQLAGRDSEIRRRLEQSVRSGLRTDQVSLQDQWQKLILAPLSALQSDGRVGMVLLVVDALDECNQDQDVRALLEAMTTIPAEILQRLRIFVTSRPELTMRHHFAKVKEDGQRTLILHQVEASTVKADIRKFLSTEFAAIRDERGFASEWPGALPIQQLTTDAAGLFIYAATTCRFVRQGRQFAKQRLDLVLSGSPTAVTEPERQLDKIYMAVLASAISDDFSAEEKQAAYAQLRYILGSLLVLKEDLPLRALSAILGYSIDDLQGVLENLHAVLDVTEDLKHIVRLYHPSFRDFLENSARCTNLNLVIVRDEAHSRLMYACMRVMRSTLKQDIYNLGWTTNGICMRYERKSRTAGCYIPIEVQYACEHWTSHFRHGWETSTEEHEVESFLHEHFLHWIEAAAWCDMDVFRLGVVFRRKVSQTHLPHISIRVLPYIAQCEKVPSLAVLVADAKRFVGRLDYIFRASPLQVYLSAALFERCSSGIHKQFGTTCLPRWIRRWPSGNYVPNYPNQSLKDISPRCKVFEFSPEGRAIACVVDNFVRLFDLDNSEQRDLPHSTDDEDITELRFSPDAEQVAVTHHHHNIWIWNVGRRQLQCHLGGSDGRYDPGGYARLSRRIPFSDARRLVSCTLDGVISVWHTETGQLLSTAKSGMGPTTTKVFSGDAKLLLFIPLLDCAGIWRASAPSSFSKLNMFSYAVDRVCFCPNSTYIAFEDRTQTVEIRRLGDFCPAFTLDVRGKRILALDFAPDSSLLGVLISRRSGNGPRVPVLRLHSVSDGSLVSEYQPRYIAGFFNEPYLYLVSDGRSLWAIISANDNLIMLQVSGSAEHVLQSYLLNCGRLIVSKDRKKVATLADGEEHIAGLWKVEDLCNVHNKMSGMLGSFLGSLSTATGVAYLLAEGRSFAIRDPGNMVGSYFQIGSAVGQWNHWLEVVHDEKPKKLVAIPNDRQVSIYFPALKST